ncbi:carboxylic ester hydrolase [Microbacterium barkeri]|uniref:Carboxylic ester hydrolase n=1 Tax=Microbacterium barkeri TaxID=33917 RepID=A0A9W6H4T0_9MICO|nr:carboxylesterase family protein [Microbacterium barkeri]MDR6877206.1 para-nitrobenzyl esterase [Microbacterium barkeri]GLJ62627.1 carboxylic ester hydrolase [Microbacterium barkeri]
MTASIPTDPHRVEQPVVDTEAGRVRGFWRRDCATFLGIPFAQPPIGRLRFQAPAPHEPWDGVLDATRQGATPQRGATGITLIPEPSVPGRSTLNVNVFTPTTDPGAQLPVLVYFHGGAYVSGSIASPWYDGRSFARDGVVVVTASYRLGFDGFGWIADAPSNRGVRDWLAALEWVQRNIRSFGGDPNRVTIAGQSAGGGAVLTLLGMPAAQHLFSAVWAMSATIGVITPEEAERFGRRAAAEGGVEPTVAGWRALTEKQVRDAAKDLIAMRDLHGAQAVLSDGLRLGPAIDGELILEPTLRALAKGVGSDKPLVIGTTDDEFSMIVDDHSRWLRWVPAWLVLTVLGLPRKRRRAYLRANAELRRERGVPAAIGRFVTDALFRRHVVRIARARSAATSGGRTWAYRFEWVSPARGWSLHCLDVPFFFDVLDAEGVDLMTGEDPPQELADAVHGAAVGFIRTRAADWSPWSAGSTPSRVFAYPATAETESLDAYDGAIPLA